MYVYTCMHVCMHIATHVCMYAFMHVRMGMYARTGHLCMYVWACMGIYVRVSVYTYVHKYVLYAFTHAYVYVTGPAKTGHICTQILHHFSNYYLIHKNAI